MSKSINKFLEETERVRKENEELQRQLREARETIDAIKSGNIDALVVPDKKNLKVYTEKTADKTYRILIEKMHEGAVTLNKEGTILYSNSCFSEMVNMPIQKVIGSQFQKFVGDSSIENFEVLFKKGWDGFVREEVHIHGNDKIVMPVLMSVNSFPLDDVFVLSIILTDLTTQNQNKQKLILRTTQLEEKSLELEVSNRDLAHQNKLKEKRAAELDIANIELAHQSALKEKRAAELVIANKELAYQNELKEKRALELSKVNKELTTFTYISSHDLQEPLRKIQNFVNLIVQEEEEKLSDTGKGYFLRIKETARRMQTLLEDLLKYARVKSDEPVFEIADLNLILSEVLIDFDHVFQAKKATIEVKHLGDASVIPFQFKQLFQNLIGNSLKFANPEIPLHITIKSKLIKGDKSVNKNLSPEKNYLHIIFTDNGIGFDPKYNDKIFEVFQRLHTQDKYKGTGIGLAICKRIVENHNGVITATGIPGKGASFDIYLPVE